MSPTRFRLSLFRLAIVEGEIALNSVKHQGGTCVCSHQFNLICLVRYQEADLIIRLYLDGFCFTKFVRKLLPFGKFEGLLPRSPLICFQEVATHISRTLGNTDQSSSTGLVSRR
ncbi:uncharacterized protein LOC126788378 [Argentina anserina]|uniref:uncharacterized protein LOC126788378 n=1 Tax=Argentina anserina TaxID=57926 RepID=UPI0021761E5F|nr:uncharacterized protein LOC126788378 [Potentilla anserina]